MNRFERTTKDSGIDRVGMVRAVGLEDLYHPSSDPFSRYVAGSVRSADWNRPMRSLDNHDHERTQRGRKSVNFTFADFLLLS